MDETLEILGVKFDLRIEEKAKKLVDFLNANAYDFDIKDFTDGSGALEGTFHAYDEIGCLTDKERVSLYDALKAKFGGISLDNEFWK